MADDDLRETVARLEREIEALKAERPVMACQRCKGSGRQPGLYNDCGRCGGTGVEGAR